MSYNLPGIELTVKDGNLVLPAEDFGTGTVLIVAPTSDGAVANKPMVPSPKKVTSSEGFTTLGFGTFNKSNPLARLWKQAHDAGCRNIYLVELSAIATEPDTESTPEQIKTSLKDLYEVLENQFEADIIVLGGVYAMGAPVEGDYASELANYCQKVSAQNNQVVGIMSVEPFPADGETGKQDFSDLAKVKAYAETQELQTYNQYLQIIGGAPLWFEINNEPYADSFAGAYAGMISILPSYSATTNKIIPGALFPAFNLSQVQIQNLVANHIVAPRTRNGRVVIAEGITTAEDESDFVRLSTVRIVNDAVNLIREIAEPYIGEPNTLARRNALETGIRSGLNNMIKRGALTDFRFSIKATLEDQISGNMRISLDLVPVFETRRIVITLALKPVLD